MKNFREWYSNTSIDRKFFMEQGESDYIDIPPPVEIPKGSGRFYYVLQNPDDPDDKRIIDANLPSSKNIVKEFIRNNTKKGGAGANTNASSLINPVVTGNQARIGGNQIVSMFRRNEMLKDVIAERLRIPREEIGQRFDFEIIALANETGQTHFVDSAGEVHDLKAEQEKYINKIGLSQSIIEMSQGGLGARILPKDWTGIKLLYTKLGGSRQAVPKGVILVNHAGQEVDRTGNLVQGSKKYPPIGTARPRSPSMLQNPADYKSPLEDDQPLPKRNIPDQLPLPKTPTPPFSNAPISPLKPNNRPVRPAQTPVTKSVPASVPSPTVDANNLWQEVEQILEKWQGDYGNYQPTEDEIKKINQYAQLKGVRTNVSKYKTEPPDVIEVYRKIKEDKDKLQKNT